MSVNAKEVARPCLAEAADLKANLVLSGVRSCSLYSHSCSLCARQFDIGAYTALNRRTLENVICGIRFALSHTLGRPGALVFGRFGTVENELWRVPISGRARVHYNYLLMPPIGPEVPPVSGSQSRPRSI